MTWTMPAEWELHKRTWMAWPCGPTAIEFPGSPSSAYELWACVANAIARFEPVVMVCNSGDGTEARRYLDASVSIMETELGDAWMRDFGPTFVIDETGALGAVDWTFNGWGGRTFPEASADAHIARFVADASGAARVASRLVTEGGGLHVDGEGTVLLTETAQLNRNRNPNWTREEIETELHDKLGTRKAIWLPRGLIADTSEVGTDGHVDTLASFVKPGVAVVHGQPDPSHPDRETAMEIESIMRAETDAHGRKLEVIVLDAPDKRHADGSSLSCSYVNFSFVNGGVVLCGFDDPKDEQVAGIFARLFNDRMIEQVPALDIFKSGGGVHCITQQEPLCRTNGG
jgi:agmatine deiminase